MLLSLSSHRYRTLGAIIGYLAQHYGDTVASTMFNDIVSKFLGNQRSCDRQGIVQVADAMIDYAPLSVFKSAALPPLLALVSDSIANVRIVLARTLSRASSPEFLADDDETREQVSDALTALGEDSDPDVVFWATTSSS